MVYEVVLCYNIIFIFEVECVRYVSVICYGGGE